MLKSPLLLLQLYELVLPCTCCLHLLLQMLQMLAAAFLLQAPLAHHPSVLKFWDVGKDLSIFLSLWAVSTPFPCDVPFLQVDLNLHQTNSASIHSLTNLVCKVSGGFGQTHNSLTLADRCYIYSGLIYHPGICAIQHTAFFQLCKTKGISFNVKERAGTLFHLVDTLSKGCLGLICVGQDAEEALSHFWAAVEFLQYQLDNTNVDDSQTNFHHVAAACRTLNQSRLLALANRNRRKQKAVADPDYQEGSRSVHGENHGLEGSHKDQPTA